MAQVRRALEIAQQFKDNQEELRAFIRVRRMPDEGVCVMREPNLALSFQAISSYDRTLSMRLYVHCTLFKYNSYRHRCLSSPAR